jgi:hypothetical protein
LADRVLPAHVVEGKDGGREDRPAAERFEVLGRPIEMRVADDPEQTSWITTDRLRFARET